MKKLYRILIFLILFSTGALYAQEDETVEVYDLSLEQLMQMEVVSASKTEEGINDAPGVISTIGAEEIRRLGGTNLAEVLERSAGVYITGTYYMPDNYISLRGDASSHYNRHVLILINGRPVRETLFGGVDFSILKSIPLSAIRQIEIIRGPGSVLYGSNAYTGVINILIDKKKEGLITRVSGGSLATKNMEVANTHSKGDLILNTSLKYSRSEGWENEIISELNESLVRKMGYYTLGAYARADYNNLEVTGMINHTSQNNFGTLPINDFPGGTPFLNRDITSTRFMLDAGYEFAISENWSLKANSTFNESIITYDATDGDFEGQSSDLLLEVTNFITATENINVTAGGTAYIMSAGGELSDNPDQGIAYTNEVWYSAYFQADFRPIEQLKLIAGAQMNAPEGVGINFVPRLGAIYQANEHLGVKALYGQAFRTAYIAEQQSFEPPILIGNPDLTPQTIETIDLQVFYNSSKIQGSVTAFNSKMKNVISLTSPPNQTYVNQGEVSFMGVEAEGKWVITENFFVNASYTYQTNENAEEQENITLMPQQLTKVNFSYKRDWLTIGVSNMTVARVPRVDETNSAVRSVNPTAVGYNFTSLNLDIDIYNMLNVDKAYGLNFQCYVSNLFDEEIYYPEYTRRNINSIGGRAGRIVNLGVQLKF